jgi:hypothetical protein
MGVTEIVPGNLTQALKSSINPFKTSKTHKFV